MKRHAIIALSLAALIVVASFLYFSATNGTSLPSAAIERFNTANASAEKGESNEAISSYESLLRDGFTSPGIFYNLAATQHRAGDLGKAILNYERAAALDPTAPDVITNLSRARKDAASIEPEPTGWIAANSLTPSGWSTLGAVSLLALAAATLLAALQKIIWPRNLIVVGTATGFLAICASTMAIIVQHNHQANRAIVSGKDVPLRVSPFDSAKAVATLPAGRSLTIVPDKTHGDFQLARLSSGQTGWLKHGEAELITPK